MTSQLTPHLVERKTMKKMVFEKNSAEIGVRIHKNDESSQNISFFLAFFPMRLALQSFRKYFIVHTEFRKKYLFLSFHFQG